jgi:hypothetical protein
MGKSVFVVDHSAVALGPSDKPRACYRCIQPASQRMNFSGRSVFEPVRVKVVMEHSVEDRDEILTSRLAQCDRVHHSKIRITATVGFVMITCGSLIVGKGWQDGEYHKTHTPIFDLAKVRFRFQT